MKPKKKGILESIIRRSFATKGNITALRKTQTQPAYIR